MTLSHSIELPGLQAYTTSANGWGANQGLHVYLGKQATEPYRQSHILLVILPPKLFLEENCT